MNTRRVKFIALLWWVLPGSSMAIGIGDMTVTSYINQPLQANIVVLQPDGLLESEVIASLASPDDFDRLGLERHYSLNSLRFAADFSRAARPVITVSTDDPVLEPYLSFLLELKWPEGRVLREYTVFLDLPPRRVSQSSSNSDGRDPQPFGEVAVDQYRVAPNDTMGAIAAVLKPSELTIDQMMLAIKAANPGSFLRDNINGIRVGVLLTIPSDFSDVPSARAASREVANEWVRWKAPRSSELRIVADNELLDFAEPSNGPTSLSEEIREPETANVTASDSPNDDSPSDLALIEARLMALSEQLSDIEEVVDSKDQEIARLKAELAERPVRGVTPTAAIDAEPAPVSQSTSEGESSLFSGLFWFILAAGLIAIGWFNRHRLIPNERESDEKADILASSDLSGGLDELLPVPSKVGSQPDSEPVVGPERGYGESLLTGYAADQTLADAVAEADIYVAYGRHQHALDTLEAGSAAEPSNASGLLKMLDIYMSLDRIDEATELLALIEGTGDTVALESAKSRLDSHQASLSGDDAARELASLDDAEPAVEASADTLDISLDLEFQEAAKPAPEEAEVDASGALDAEDPAETALDLALAYIDMGDKAGAADLLQTVLSSGDEAQREHAQSLLDSLE